MKKKDTIIILAILLTAGLLFLFTYPGFRPLQPLPVPTPAIDELTPAAALPRAKAYVQIMVGSYVYAPIPLTKEEDITLKHDGKENILRVTADSAWMESSNCDNQDCVHQGIVTLENRASRALWGYIICLPNKVQIELMTNEEAQAKLSEFNQSN